MKKSTLLALSFLAIAVFIAGCGQPKVAAVVNGEKIYTSQVEEILEDLKKDHPLFFKGKDGREFSKQAKRDILEGLIENVLIDQKAEELGIEVTEKEIDSEIEKYKRMFGEKNFAEQMKRMGWSEKKLREEVRKSLLIRKAKEKVRETAEVTDEEIKEFYQKNKESFRKPPRVKVALIVLRTRENAEKIREKALQGEDFLKLSSTYSEEKETRGKLLWMDGRKLPASVFSAALKLKEGEVSSILKGDGKFYLIKLEEKDTESYTPLKDAKKTIKENLLIRKQAEVWEEWLKKLKKGAKIKIYLSI